MLGPIPRTFESIFRPLGWFARANGVVCLSCGIVTFYVEGADLESLRIRNAKSKTAMSDV